MSVNRKARILWKQLFTWMIMACMLCACGADGSGAAKDQTENDPEDPDLWYGAAASAMNILTDRFAYQQDDNGCLYYFDVEEGKAEVICRDPQCSHEDSNCPAWFEGGIYPIRREAGKIYYYARPYEENPGALSLYEMNEDGSHRRKLCNVTEKATLIFQVLRCGDKVLISGMNQYDENQVPLDQQESFLVIHDLQTNQAKTLFSGQETASALGTMCLFDDEVRIPYSYYDTSEEEFLSHGEEADFRKEHQLKEWICVHLPDQTMDRIPLPLMENDGIPVSEQELLISFDDTWKTYHVDTGDYKESGTFEGDGLAPVCLFSDQNRMAVSYDTKGKELLYWKYEDAALRPLGRVKNIYLTAAFEHTAYGMLIDEETGNGKTILLNTEDMMQGKFDSYRIIDMP